MNAKIRFVTRAVFNHSPNKIICPGILVGRAENRRMWTMCFTSNQKINELIYVGDLRWLVSPVEQDFGKGIKFFLISDPKKFADGPSTTGMFVEGELLG